MDQYELIYEYLQESVNNGLFTVEEAEELNGLAYEKYVTEGNAYNKYISKNQEEYKKEVKKENALRKLANTQDAYTSTRTYRKMAEHMKKGDGIRKKIKNETKGNYDISYTPGNRRRLGSKNTPLEYDVKTSKLHDGKNGSELSHSINREIKKKWMRDHGDEGIRPEEKYKKGRYLQAQKDMKESVDDLKLLVFESYENGLISDEKKDELLGFLSE